MTADTIIERYQEDGFVVVTDLLSPAEKRDIAVWTSEIEQWPETPHTWMQYFEPNRATGAKQLCRTENFIPYHDGIRALLSGGALLDLTSRLLGEAAVLYKDKINFKLPGASGFEPHQDAPAFTGQGQSIHITAMIAADAATVANGCLEIVRGGHRLGPLPHTDVGGAIPADIVATMEWTPLEMSPGDVAFFGSYIPHRSGPNTTASPRRTLYITYNRASEGDRHDAYYGDKREAFPPDAEKVPGKDYSEGARVYNLANPIRHFR
jgi:ectoine hydroxylase-related dioxygenase (phytanoyl-CoA dioxygenase family)